MELSWGRVECARSNSYILITWTLVFQTMEHSHLRLKIYHPKVNKVQLLILFLST